MKSEGSALATAPFNAYPYVRGARRDEVADNRNLQPFGAKQVLKQVHQIELRA